MKRPFLKIDGSTRLVGVFGFPIRHTASPAFQNAAFQHLGINAVYVPLEVNPSDLKDALKGIVRLNFWGANLTVPHKILAVKYVDVIDPRAKLLGAVNTVINKDGKLHGFSTDGYGFEKSLEEDFKMEVAGKSLMIVGTGGAGRSVALYLALRKAGKLTLLNRTRQKALALAREIRKHSQCNVEVIASDEELKICKASAEADVVVNATSLGLKDSDPCPLPTGAFHSHVAYYDMIYRPPETEFLKRAKEVRALHSNGLGMLLHQGARAFELWTGSEAPIAVMRKALIKAVYS